MTSSYAPLATSSQPEFSWSELPGQFNNDTMIPYPSGEGSAIGPYIRYSGFPSAIFTVV